MPSDAATTSRSGPGVMYDYIVVSRGLRPMVKLVIEAGHRDGRLYVKKDSVRQVENPLVLLACTRDAVIYPAMRTWTTVQHGGTPQLLFRILLGYMVVLVWAPVLLG